MYISVRIHQTLLPRPLHVNRNISKLIFNGWNINWRTFIAILQERMKNTSERHICTGEERAIQMCISVRIHQSLASFSSQIPRMLYQHLKTAIPNEWNMNWTNFMQFWMKKCEIHLKDIFVQVQKQLYKCVCISEFINLWPFLDPRSLDCNNNI